MNQNLDIGIKKLSDKRKEEWDSYVRNSSESTFFHFSGWRDVLEETFNCKPHYLFAENQGKICGLLPLFLVKSFLTGKALISLPFVVYGGICADNEGVEGLLIDEAKRIAKKENVDYLELRKQKTNNYPEFCTNDLYVSFIKKLTASSEDLWEELDRKARGAVRKGIKFGLTTEMNAGRIKEFYNIFAESYRNLGSPVFGLNYLQKLLETFKKDATIVCVDYNKKMIAGVLTFFFKDTVIPYYGGSLPCYLFTSCNNFMYWELMKYSCDNGYKYFDFGRSRKGAGSYNFKKNWGFEPLPLNYQYFLINGHEIPNVTPSNDKYSLPRKIWRKLPLSLTKMLGHRIIRHIP